MANGGGRCAPARTGLRLGPVAADLYGDPRLAPLLRRLLLHSGTLLDVGAGSISLLDARRDRYVKMAERGALCQLGQSFSLEQGITGQVVAHRAPVVLARYSAVSGGHLEAAHRANRGAVAAVPIWWRGEVIGANVAFACRSRRFTAAEVDQLEIITQVAAAAIVSAGASDPSLGRLLRDDPRQAGSSSRVVTEVGPIRPVSREVAELAAELVAYADRAVDAPGSGPRLRVAIVHRPEGVRLLVHGGTAQNRDDLTLLAGDERWRELVTSAAGGVSAQLVPGWGTLVRADLPHQQVPAGPPPSSSPLTAREQQTLALLARGLTDRQVASALVISPRTVEKHVGAVLRKTGATTRTGAVVHAIARGWLPKGPQMGDPPHAPDQGSGLD